MEELLKNKKYYVIGGNYAVAVIFKNKGAEAADSIAEADIVVWTGGSDVDPLLYNERQHPKTYTDPKRDRWEKACYHQAVLGRKRLLIGICRGGQFLNVMNGGSLWQDVSNHAFYGTHPMLYEMKTAGGLLQRMVQVNSTHHQMMIPNSRDRSCEVWGRATESTYKEAGTLLANEEKSLFRINPKHGHWSDCEIVFYKHTRSLCFQPHPEYNSKTTTEIFWTCVERAMAA